MAMRSETDEERRRRRRALIRAHHPDRGGDTAEFVRMLRHLDQERPLSAVYPEIRFVRQRRWWQRAAAPISRLRRTSRRPKRVV